MNDIQGYCDDRFLPLRDAFVANFAEDLELGASLGVRLECRGSRFHSPRPCQRYDVNSWFIT